MPRFNVVHAAGGGKARALLRNLPIEKQSSWTADGKLLSRMLQESTWLGIQALLRAEAPWHEGKKSKNSTISAVALVREKGKAQSRQQPGLEKSFFKRSALPIIFLLARNVFDDFQGIIRCPAADW